MADQNERRGGQYELTTETRSARGRRFACEPLRSGWVVGWMIDGERIEQHPQLRVEANAQLVLRADADAVVAIFAIRDDQPPCVLELGSDETHGERIGGAVLSRRRA